jgi:hypothetical protein
MGTLAKRTMWLVGLVLLCVGLVVGLGLNTVVDAADAAKKKELKTLWAVVDAEGNLVRNKGATSAVRSFEGAYEVSFNRNVSNCAYTATTADEVVALTGVDEGSNSRSVAVYIASLQAQTDAPFHLQVTC